MILRRVIRNILIFLSIDFPLEDELRAQRPLSVDNIEDDIMYNDFIQWTD
jgi:hypothetical protein